MVSRIFVVLIFFVALVFDASGQDTPPNTDISGVYEVVVGTENAEPLLTYFAQFGFSLIEEAALSAEQAQQIYGVESAVRSLRLQNGDIDTHGLLRILEWADPIGPGVGYAPPETIGQRMAVMRTRDVFRIDDVFSDMRQAGAPWLPTNPVYDDLYDLDQGAYSIENRRVGVREMAIYGESFNHVFFQRYGYTIPGYGTIDDAPLQTSEFTHHDFIIRGDLAEVTQYYVEVLGFKSENDPVIDGDWQDGPRHVFGMEPGEAHWYRGFVSPNNICGKLKFFSARDPDHVRDRSEHQRLGEPGITMHTLYTSKLGEVYKRASRHEGIAPSAIAKNEFGEHSFVFTGPDGATWQILETPDLENEAVVAFELVTVGN